jgi:hypothetical protein
VEGVERYGQCVYVKEIAMWMVCMRAPRPDAGQWEGRRFWAALDAVAWPVGWVVLAAHLPAHGGIVGPFLAGVAVLTGLARLHKAVWRNERYFFTTWRVAKVVVALLVIGWVMKAMMVA